MCECATLADLGPRWAARARVRGAWAVLVRLRVLVPHWSVSIIDGEKGGLIERLDEAMTEMPPIDIINESIGVVLMNSPLFADAQSSFLFRPPALSLGRRGERHGARARRRPKRGGDQRGCEPTKDDDEKSPREFARPVHER